MGKTRTDGCGANMADEKKMSLFRRWSHGSADSWSAAIDLPKVCKSVEDTAIYIL